MTQLVEQFSGQEDYDVNQRDLWLVGVALRKEIAVQQLRLLHSR